MFYFCHQERHRQKTTLAGAAFAILGAGVSQCPGWAGRAGGGPGEQTGGEPAQWPVPALFPHLLTSPSLVTDLQVLTWNQRLRAFNSVSAAHELCSLREVTSPL